MKVQLISFMTILTATAARSQTLMAPAGHQLNLIPSDAAVLDSRAFRTDLPCVVKPLNPQLGFDLAFHSGYEVNIPFGQLAAPEERLTIIFRVTPQNKPDQAAYFEQKFRIPEVYATTKGKAEFHGNFVTGEGAFQIELLARDRSERFCASHWQIVADTNIKGRHGITPLTPGLVQPEVADLFARGAPVKPEERRPLNVLVFLNLSPQSSTMSALPQTEIEALFSILRRVPRASNWQILDPRDQPRPA